MITTPNIEQAKRLIKLEKEKPVIVQAQDDDFNRKMLEYGKFDILLSPEAGIRKHKLRQLDSGFNHVLAEIAVKNKVAIGIDIAEISRLEKKEKAIRLSRIAQNIKICRKAKTQIKALNAKDKKDAAALLTSLGASAKQAKTSLF
jgi:RNase P/RNase MRP subunit p30